MWDVTTTGVTAALDALGRRGEVRAHNISNAETPGFRANHVDFEDALATAWRRGTPERTQVNEVVSPTLADATGNTVDLETEMIGSMKDGLTRDAMIQSFNFKTSNLRMAIVGRR